MRHIRHNQYIRELSRPPIPRRIFEKAKNTAMHCFTIRNSQRQYRYKSRYLKNVRLNCMDCIDSVLVSVIISKKERVSCY